MFRMTVADVFAIRGRGLVATGRVEEGTIRVGDMVTVNGREVQVAAIEAFRKKLDAATAGETVGLLLAGLEREHVASGDVITSDATTRGSSWEQDFPGGLPR